MNRHNLHAPVSPNHVEIRQCSTCRVGRNIEIFFRKGKVWKTCNECSAKGAAWRKKQTADATHAFIQQTASNWHLAELPDLMFQYSDCERRYQQHAGQQWQEQRDPRVALNLLVNNPDLYSPSPLELSEQQRRLKYDTQHLFHPHAFLPGSTFEDVVSYQNPQPGLRIEPFRTYDSNASEVTNESTDTLLDYGVMKPNFYCNLYNSADLQQQELRCSYGWYDSDPNLDLQFDYDGMCSDIQKINLDKWLADGLAAEGMATEGLAADGFPPLPQSVLLDEGDSSVSAQLAYQSDSLLQNHPDDWSLSSFYYMEGATSYPGTSQATDVDMIGTDLWLTQNEGFNPVDAIAQVQTGAPVQRVRKPRVKPATINFDAYFADFDPAQDLLCQPTSPTCNLTGERLAKRLISEIGLAIRLSELHHRWRSLRSTKDGTKKWFQEVETLDRLEERRIITPWRPLSNWFFIYEIQYEDILNRYAQVPKSDWQAKRKRVAEEQTLVKSLMASWGEEVLKLIQDTTKALLDLLVELTGQNDPGAMKALDKQIRNMKTKVVDDCRGDKPHDRVLYLDVDNRLGVYIQGNLGK